MCAELADGSTEWVDLSMAKEAYPIQAAEYAVANKLVSEPAFSWWVPYTLRKRDLNHQKCEAACLCTEDQKVWH
jgi:hypothetical protein